MFLSRWIQRLCFLLMGTAGLFVPRHVYAQEKPEPLEAIKVKEPNGQILSYRYLGASADVIMRGTRIAPEARIRLKVGSRPGFVELDINRGQITGLKPADQFGSDFLTYVLWAVSVDGKAANLGEITFDDDRPVSINVTTPYQTFWLMLTAEPHYAVVDPSRIVVLYSVNEKTTAEKTALPIDGELFYYTHYPDYDQKPASAQGIPNALLQARKAVQLASKSGILAAGRSKGARFFEEERTREVMKKANFFLARAEAAYKEDPNGSDVAQFSRTAAQIAENARALSAGAVGGVLVTQLVREVEQLRGELTKLQPDPEPQAAVVVADVPAANAEPEDKGVAGAGRTKAPNIVVQMISQPLTWFSIAGWGLALLLIFRRRSL